MGERARILGVPVDALTVAELHTYLHERIASREKAMILNVNALAMNLAYEHTWLQSLFNDAALVFADGFGVVLGGRLLGYRIPERITYADWMWKLAEFAADHMVSFFFLGGKPGVAARAATKLTQKYPSLCITGVLDGYFDKTSGSTANEAVIQQINACRPDILLVGFGMPLQEKWLMENWDRIDARVALTGGAVFDYVAGEVTRAPRWMTDHGLEWLGRLVIEPRRLWKRYLIGNPLFLFRVLRQKLGLLKFD